MKFLSKGILFSFLATPFLVLAQPGQGTGQAGQGTGQAGQGVAPSSSLENPLRSNDLMELLQEILDVIMIFAVPLIVFMIIYAGFLYVMARGNEGEVTKASKALLYAVIGGVIILGANIILEVISGTVDAFR